MRNEFGHSMFLPSVQEVHEDGLENHEEDAMPNVLPWSLSYQEEAQIDEDVKDATCNASQEHVEDPSCCCRPACWDSLVHNDAYSDEEGDVEGIAQQHRVDHLQHPSKPIRVIHVTYGRLHEAPAGSISVASVSPSPFDHLK